jgi:hypothetical protein
MNSSDISDSLDEMKIRVEYKHLHYAYFYDGETQSVTVGGSTATLSSIQQLGTGRP